MTDFWTTLPRPIIGLSPMDGVTDHPFRHIQKRYGNPDLIFTEFVRVERLCAGEVKLRRMLLYDESQHTDTDSHTDDTSYADACRNEYADTNGRSNDDSHCYAYTDGDGASADRVARLPAGDCKVTKRAQRNPQTASGKSERRRVAEMLG